MLRDRVPIEGKDRLDHWLAALDVYGVQYLILDTERDRELLRLVQSNPRWTVDFQEGNSMLFARTQAHISARVAAWQEKVRHERIQEVHLRMMEAGDRFVLQDRQGKVFAFKKSMNGHGKSES